MKKTMRTFTIAAAMAVAALGFGSTAAHAAHIGIGVYVGGPGAYVPPCPGPGYQWTAGYWDGGYWVPGQWVFVGGPAYYGAPAYYGGYYHRDWDDDDGYRGGWGHDDWHRGWGHEDHFRGEDRGRGWGHRR